MSSASAWLPDALRAVLLDPADAVALRVHGRTEAAVLVALYERDDELHVVFTRRRHDLRSHAGEISFPGGRRDDDDGDLVATALREAHEEIGLEPDAVTLVGALTPTPTVATSFAVYPFVGVVAPDLRWTPSAREVDEVIELGIGELRAAHARKRLLHRGIPFRSDVYTLAEERVIWGATARIVGDLIARVAPVIDGRAVA